ncbi:MAG: carbohydrate ABC transporter permease [Clostridiales bacterium]|jgi:putative aldouronate transport system permease protein|nr:carbohydrate ABC transporter permease [Clostridiales bacterium]
MRTASDKRWAFAGHALMLLLSFAALLPFALLVISSFTSESAAVRNGYSLFPEAWSLNAYRYIAGRWDMIGRGYLVTFTVTLMGTAGSIIMSAMLGYVLSQKDLPGRKALLFLVTFTMMFNGGLTATYIVYTQIFHIKNTIFGLLVPGLLMNGYNVMMFRNYFEMTIPAALLESAKIDGATETKTFFKIVMPLSLPMVSTVGMMVALMYWNDWTNGLYYLSPSSRLQSIQTILNNINENIKFLQSPELSSTVIQNMELPSTTVRMAVAVVGILPILFLYPVMQRWFVRGMTVGAVKE